MNLRLLLRCSLVAALFFLAVPAPAGEVVLRVDNPASHSTPTNATVVALLFNSANTFVGLRDPILRVTLPPGGAAPARISGLPAGEYALVVYRDENRNGRLDKNFIGIPREHLGFSNRYWPDGPPTFKLAAFQLGEGETKAFDVELRSVFGDLGRIGLGVGAVAQTSPYRDTSGGVVQPIPAVSYIGDRVQIFGPAAQVGLLKFGEAGLAATASYRLGAYRDEDSPYLEGLGDRESTLMSGLALQSDLPGGLEVSAGYEHDVLDRIGGGTAKLGLEKSFQTGRLTLSPKLAAEWISKELADYDYGVSADRSRPDRPAYRPGDAVNGVVGLGIMVELRNSWRIILDGSVTFLDADLSASPIVEEDRVWGGFAALTRLF